MSLRHQKKVVVEKYFDFVNERARCTFCKQLLKKNRTFNLKVHLRKTHKITDEILNENLKAQFGIDVSKTNIKKQTIRIDVCKNELIRSYIGLIMEDSLPFEFLDSENFAVFVDPICQGLKIKFGKELRLNSNKCKKVLKLIADNIRNDIKSDVSKRLLCMNVSCAHGLSRNMFGISIQFIKEGEVVNHTLGLVELKKPGDNALLNFATELANILTIYGISLSQVVSVSSDSSEDIIKASKDLTCLSVYDEEFQRKEVDEGNELYLKNIQLFEDTSVIDLGDIKITRCMAYVAQLCTLDVIKNPEIASYIFSCRNFVKFLKNPANGYGEIFEQKNLLMPQLDSPSQWGSTYAMLACTKSAKNVVVKIEPIEDKSIDENFVINENFWNFIEAFCIALEPLQLAINKFQEEVLHFGNFYAEWLKCKLCTEKMYDNCSNKHVKNILKILLHSMETRTNELLTNENLLACLYLDPRFNHTLTLTKKLQALACLKKMYEKHKHNTNQRLEVKKDEVSIADSSSQMETGEFSEKADEYLNEYLTRNFVPNCGEDIDVALKLENLQMPFCRVDSNVLQFWLEKQHSDAEAYALSNVCFAFPANQIPMEQTFSSLKNIFEDIRNNRDTLENILLVKQSPTYLDNAVENLNLFEEEN